MKVSTTAEKITIIEFSKDELEACCLTYENITRDVIRSKTAIYRIISEAASISGEEKSITENTDIDILPDGEGGCIIILNNTRVKSCVPEVRIYRSSSPDGILDLAKAVNQKEVHHSSLYKIRDDYYLTVRAEKRVFSLCGEFLELYSESRTDGERLAEYGEILIEGNALEVLCGTASEQ